MKACRPSAGTSRALLASAAVLLVLGCAGAMRGAAADGPISPDRAAVWRAIFARPALPHGAPPHPAQSALGADLFRDTRLSGSGTMSCASCHDPGRAFTDGRKTGRGAAGAVLSRNVPALYDLAAASRFFWDGRAETLAAQARVPITAPDEMAGSFPVIVQRLDSDAALKARFAAAFPASGRIGEAEILDALVAYERSLKSPETPFDRWVAGDDDALSAAARRGFDLFVGKGGCVTCHGGWRLTDDSFHDVGLPSGDLGRGALDLDPAGQGIPAFKTPSLREVAHTAPYMHDGSLATLADVVAHYAGGLVRRPSLAPTVVRDLTLTDDEKAALVAFLTAVSSERGEDKDKPMPPAPKK